MQTRRRQPDQRRQDRRPGGAPLQRIKADVSFAAAPSGEGRHRLAGCGGRPERGAVDRHRRLPGHRDGQPGGQRRRRGLLDRWRQRLRVHAPRSRPTTRPRWRGRRRPTCPARATRWRWASSNGQIVATGGWAAAARRPTPGLRPGGRRVDGGGRRTGVPVGLGSGRRGRQAVRRRWLHDRGLHADVERRGGVRPGDRQLGAAGGLPGCGGVRVLRRDRRDGLLHRRQRRRGGERRRLRLRPGRRRVDPDRGRAGRHVGQLVRRGQRHARRQRRRPGRRRSPTPRSPTTRPRTRGPICPTPTPPATAAAWRAGSTRSAARPAASPPRWTARCCPGSRTAAARRPTSSG